MEEQKGQTKYAMVAILLCGALLCMMNATLLSPALPTIMEDFGVSATTVQWLSTAYTLTEAVIIPLSAYLLGRFSVRKLFIFGLSMFTIFSLVAAAAPNFPVLLVARICQSIGSGIVMPMTVTLVMLSFPREKRGLAMGLTTLVVGVAPAIGPLVGGILCDSVGWRALFGIITVLGALILLFGSKFVKNHEGFESYPLDVPSVVLMACGVVCLLYGIASITSSTNVALPIILIIVGLVVLAFFVRRQLKLEQPMLKVTVFKERNFRVDVIAVCFLQAALLGCTVILPLYIQNVLGYSATVSGLVVLPGAIAGAIIGFFSGRLFDRYGVRAITVIGVTILAFSGIGMATFQIDSSIAYVCVVYTCFAFAAQMITTPMNSWGTKALDNKVIQHANSLSNSINQVAGSIGTALLTALTALGASAAPNGTALEQTYMGDHIAFIGLAVLTVICALIVYVFAYDKKKQPAAETAPAAAAATAAAGAAATGVAYAGAEDASRSWRVYEAMDTSPKFVRSDQTVGEAFDLFAATETDGVPIVDDAGRVVGYLSDGDLLSYLGQKDLSYANPSVNIFHIVDDEHIQDTMNDLFDLNVMTLATKKVITLDENTTLEKACTVFADRKLKKAPVVQDGKLVGSLSRRNIVAFIAEKSERKGTAGGAASSEGAASAE